jgi:hypothetical protein
MLYIIAEASVNAETRKLVEAFDSDVRVEDVTY